MQSDPSPDPAAGAAFRWQSPMLRSEFPSLMVSIVAYRDGVRLATALESFTA
jgi:hypothetical protein